MIAFLFALSLAHATTLRVPVFVTTDKGNVPVSALNQKLAERGHSLYISEWLELRDSPMSRARIATLDANIALARTLVGGMFGETERAFEIAPGDLKAAGYETCYIGDPSEVGEVALAVSDNMYSDHFGLWGWRSRGQTVLYDEEEEGEYVRANSPSLWRRRISDDSVLLLTRVSPNGRDLKVSRIRRCE